MKRITYIFTTSRINRLNDSNYADEFFYGLRYLKNKYKFEIIEFKHIERYSSRVEYFISKLISLPLYIFSINEHQNRKIFKRQMNYF